MAGDKFNLFDGPADTPILPGEDQKLDKGLFDTKELKAALKDGSDLISEGLERAISGPTVKSMMISEDIHILEKNYVIDFTSLDEIYEFQLEAIDSLLHPDGDTALYAYTRAGLAKLGNGLSDNLDKVLVIAIAHIFNFKCKIYKDFQPNKELTIVSEKDITKMRLSI